MRRLSVGIVVESFHTGGGVERRTSELANGLISAGHDVHVYASRWADESGRDGLSLHRIPTLKLNRVTKLTSFSRLCSMLIPVARHDLIHTQARITRFDLATLGVGCHRAYLSAMGIDPDHDPDRGFHRAALAIERRMFASESFAEGRRIITNSDMCRGEIIEYYGVPETSITVVHNGVDRSEFSPERREHIRDDARRDLGLAPDEVAVLFIGPGFKRKGLDTLIKALEIVRDRGNRFRLTVVGKGDRTAYDGLGDSVMWVGQSEPGEIAKYYAAADVFALPTRYDPFANSTMEALASGVPVVTSCANGVSEILRDGESAFIVKAGDAESLSDRLSALIRDADLRARLAAAGPAAVEPFTWQATTEKTLAVYELMRP